MQQRRGSEKTVSSSVEPSNDIDDSSVSGGGGGAKLRVKDKTTGIGGGGGGSLLPPSHRLLVNRPFSCDIESLSLSPIHPHPPPPNQHHPYFYNHHAAVRQQSSGAAANGTVGGSMINSKRLNASHQQLTNIMDDELSGRQRYGHEQQQKQPPMAIQEDFALEPKDALSREKTVNGGDHHPNSSPHRSVMASNGRPVQARPPINYYVNLPPPKVPKHPQASQSAEEASAPVNGYPSSVMLRSASQCEFQVLQVTAECQERSPAPPPAHHPHHQRLQYQRSACAAVASSDGNVASSSSTKKPSNSSKSSDQPECLSSNYYPRSPTFGGVIHQNQPQRRQLSGDSAMPAALMCSSSSGCSAASSFRPHSTTTRDYGSASSIDRLAPLHKQHSSGSNIASAEAFQRPHAANTTHCVAAAAASSSASSSSLVSKQQAGGGGATCSTHRVHQPNFVLSVTSADEEQHHQVENAKHNSNNPKTPNQKQCQQKPPQQQAQQQQQQNTPRGSLRRGKAVDLSYYAGESQSSRVAPSTPVAAVQQSSSSSSTPSTVGGSQPKEQKEKSQSSRKGASIFRKLIGGGGSSGSSSCSKNTSGDEPGPSTTTGGMATSGGGMAACRSGSSAGLGSLMADGLSTSTRPDFSSDSCDFKYDERVRRRIFAHYDCVSISADARPLLNGTSRLKDANLNAATGASQASKPYTFMGAAVAAAAASSSSSGSNGQGVKSPQGEQTPTSPLGGGKDEPPSMGAVEDRGDGKSNELILSCPFFRNECGGEPIRSVSLSRDSYHQQHHLNNPTHHHHHGGGGASVQRYSFPVDENLETWHRPATAAEASVLENLSNVYLGGRLCAKRQPQLVIEHVDQGAFYYRHCFSGKAHPNYFGIDENLGPMAISIVRDKLEVPDVRRLGLTSPFIYRVIIRLSDLTTFRGAVLEESLPSYLSAKESREQQSGATATQISAQSSQAGTPGGSGGGGGAGGGAIIGAVAGSTPSGGGGASGSGGSSSTSGSSSGKIPVKELLELIIPEMQIGCLRLALPVPRTEELLLKLDEQSVYSRYKVGILYCRANQSTEEQMYNNESSSPAFDEFLDMLGQRVRLKGFDKYKGGLDSKGDTTGTYSVYTSFQQFEVMFHVSTLLPFTPQNKQQLSRKRHIGNDIVTVIFQEPDASPFSPQTVRSHFQHVFVVVRAHNPNTDNVRYSISVSRCKDVPQFGPPIPAGATFPKSKDFRDFLLTKIVNAENAVHKSEKFAAMGARTRREFMRDLAENHVTSHSLEGSASGKIASKLLGSRRKDRAKPKLYLDSFCRGALVWEVQVLAQVEDFSLCRPMECFLGISADNLVLIERSNNEALFCTPTLSIIGWTSHGNSLKLYYDHADVIILRTLEDDDSSEMQEIIKRLQSVTKGCETFEMILRRNPAGQLGFHIQHEGIVSDVEMYGYAWQAGLRQGSRLVEICKVSVATLTYERMLELLRTSVNVRVLVIPPLLEDGSPRRGCEDPYCSAVLGDDSPFLNSAVVPGGATGEQQQQAQLGATPRSKASVGGGGRPAPPSYESAISRRPISSSATGALSLGGVSQAAFTQSMHTEQSPELRSIGTTDYGYESGSGGGNHVSSTKSLDDFQRRDRRHSEELRSTSADHGGANNPAMPYPNSARATVQDPRWHPQHGPPPTDTTSGPRTDTLSSSGSTASSEMSSDSADPMHSGLGGYGRHKPTRPSELKRKVDKAHSDMQQRMAVTTPILERTSTDPTSSAASGGVNEPRAPPIPPKTYRNKYPNAAPLAPSSSSGMGSAGALSSLSSSSGHLAVPGGGIGVRQKLCSSSVQENLIRLINDLESSGEIEEAIIISTALQRTLSDSATYQKGSGTTDSTPEATGQPPSIHGGPRGKYLSPETERGIEWTSLVDAATRAIEGMTQRAMSNNASPEFSSYHLRLEAAAQRVKLLEEKVDRLQTDLEKERESKHNLEVEVLHLRDVNTRLDDECKNAKLELRKFTEWFFSAVENTNGQPPNPFVRPPTDSVQSAAGPSSSGIGDHRHKLPSPPK